jgi:hypothetical protein
MPWGDESKLRIVMREIMSSFLGFDGGQKVNEFGRRLEIGDEDKLFESPAS